VKKDVLKETLQFLTDILNKMNVKSNYLKFVSPFSMIIAGPSGSGKTYFVFRILKNHKLLLLPKKMKLRFCGFMEFGKIVLNKNSKV
jgi:pantothenate kinase-related protein Tda10